MSFSTTFWLEAITKETFDGDGAFAAVTEDAIAAMIGGVNAANVQVMALSTISVRRRQRMLGDDAAESGGTRIAVKVDAPAPAIIDGNPELGADATEVTIVDAAVVQLKRAFAASRESPDSFAATLEAKASVVGLVALVDAARAMEPQAIAVDAANSISPSASPSNSPSGSPSASPTAGPTVSPSQSPTASPSTRPSASPSASPSPSPTARPSSGPSARPSFSPSRRPSSSPSSSPSEAPSHSPTSHPAGAVVSNLTVGLTVVVFAAVAFTVGVARRVHRRSAAAHKAGTAAAEADAEAAAADTLEAQLALAKLERTHRTVSSRLGDLELAAARHHEELEAARAAASGAAQQPLRRKRSGLSLIRPPSQANVLRRTSSRANVGSGGAGQQPPPPLQRRGSSRRRSSVKRKQSLDMAAEIRRIKSQHRMEREAHEEAHLFSRRKQQDKLQQKLAERRVQRRRRATEKHLRLGPRQHTSAIDRVMEAEVDSTSSSSGDEQPPSLPRPRSSAFVGDILSTAQLRLATVPRASPRRSGAVANPRRSGAAVSPRRSPAPVPRSSGAVAKTPSRIAAFKERMRKKREQQQASSPAARWRSNVGNQRSAPTAGGTRRSPGTRRSAVGRQRSNP